LGNVCTVVLRASKRGAPKGSWLDQMLARKPRMRVTVALAIAAKA